MSSRFYIGLLSLSSTYNIAQYYKQQQSNLKFEKCCNEKELLYGEVCNLHENVYDLKYEIMRTPLCRNPDHFTQISSSNVGPSK